ncbi:hypothetical protein ACFY12_35115 [Streptomyces sp. NPDC001339]|uniref:hypothetical protein n=1 Tax=Streptomyces sp. NPDC001339 TaxID=3364563 RepID=UPI0036A9B3F9
MSTPVVRIEFKDDMPSGKYAVPVETDGELVWHVRPGAMRKEAVDEVAAILCHLAQHGWQQRWASQPTTELHQADKATQDPAHPFTLRMETRHDLPRSRHAALLEADGELVWCVRPGVMRTEFIEDAALALGYLVQHGAWAQDWTPSDR